MGVEVDLCDLKSVYAVAGQLVNGTVGSPDATTIDGFKLPHGSPGTASYSKDIKQDSWALSQKEGSDGVQRSWGWGLSGIRLPRLDVVILCAGAGGWLGVDWMVAIPEVLTNLVEAVTWPTYKLPDIGAVVKSQTTAKVMKPSDEGLQPLLSGQEKPDDPPLGAVFCSNVFGHYVLAHELMPLLSHPALRSSETGGKIIWMSSIEALSGMFDIDDIQGLKSRTPYESSKRLIDLLAITAELPSVQRVAAPFFDSSNTVSGAKAKKQNGKSKLVKPKVYLTHPGIFVSDILPLNWFLVVIYRCIFYFVRWIGSPWHTITAEKAAVAPVWMTLTEPQVLEKMEGHGAAKVKWGSATDASGEERVMRTEVPGWGWEGKLGGQLEGERRKGRRKDAVELTPEAREEFEILGAKCWAEMEELRKEWEVILGVKDGGRSNATF